MFQDMQPYVHNQFILKNIFIFCLFLIATKNINLSIILIIAYIIFIQIIKDLYPIKEDENKIEDKSKYIDNCIEMLNNFKKTL